MRERQYAERERAAAGQADNPPPPPPPVASPPTDREAAPDHPGTDTPRRGFPTRTPKSPAVPGEQGKCSVCGKVRGLVGGLIVTHQKGLGKVCPGSRHGPA